MELTRFPGSYSNSNVSITMALHRGATSDWFPIVWVLEYSGFFFVVGSRTKVCASGSCKTIPEVDAMEPAFRRAVTVDDWSTVWKGLGPSSSLGWVFVVLAEALDAPGSPWSTTQGTLHSRRTSFFTSRLPRLLLFFSAQISSLVWSLPGSAALFHGKKHGFLVFGWTDSYISCHCPPHLSPAQ